MTRSLTLLLALALAGCGNTDTTNGDGGAGDMTPPPTGDMAQPPTPSKRVIVFVWDGLRPDSINATDTPNLNALKQAGVEFQDNHSTYPTFTMMNAAAFATGSFPGTTGFYGNTLWVPPGATNPTGNTSAGTPADFVDPIFTEDWGILSDLDAYYGNQLLLVGTLFQAAQQAGLKTAAVGKSGPAFLQDYKKGGMIVDEKAIWPLALAQEVQRSNVLPQTTPFAYPAGTITLGSNNGAPTATFSKVTLTDGQTADATDHSGSPVAAANNYMMNVYTQYVLPKLPDLTLIWFRAPDSPQHNYGPGAANAKAALAQQDFLLGLLQQALKDQGIDQTTDLIVVSDHGHSNVSGPLALFPARSITPGTGGAKATLGGVDPNGFSVSGDVRLADLMTRAGFQNVFDGQGCLYVPVMSGTKDVGGTATQIYPDQTDTTGSVCGKAGTKYTTGKFVVPNPLPSGAGVHPIVIATNGGSDYIYVPDHDLATVQSVVTFLQKREEVGAIFVHSQYGTLDGTLQLGNVKLENAGRSPDIVLSYTWDYSATINGLPGIEFESMSSSNNRGMHGSFSPADVHNTLLALGPDFKTTFQDTLPTGNVDVAPTVAKIFGLSLPQADGRSLDEALKDGANPSDYSSAASTVHPTTPASGLSFQLPTDPAGATTDFTGAYSIDLKIKTLTRGSSTWKYFDSAAAVRQ
jgi:arylsulfatase A-like enzyme